MIRFQSLTPQHVRRFVGRLLLVVALVATGLTLPAAAASGSVVSDDFFGGFRTELWQVVDPRGDGQVSVVNAGTSTARLSMSVPAGSSHDAWGSNDSVRALQTTADADFEVEAKFDSRPAGAYSDQGIVVVGQNGRWLRFSVYSYGPSQMRAFAASTSPATGSVAHLSKDVTSAGQMWLRVTRTGSTWTFGYSPDGQTWTAIGSFQDTLTVTKVGPYVGNAGGSTAPQHTALVDYFFDTSSPISPEDGDSTSTEPPPDDTNTTDTTAPTITAITAEPGSSSTKISWVTDEPTTSRIDYGTTTGYGNTQTSTGTTQHTTTLTGLTPATTYHYRIRATDAASNTTTTQDRTFTTQADGPPRIELWHEGTLQVGANGTTQPWANVLGNVSDPSGISTLHYTLNGGAQRHLNIGPDDRRLQAPGDFNADIALSDLALGDNAVVITAVDNNGSTATVRTVVRRVQSAPPTLPYTLHWQAQQVQDQATVVDGKWAVVDGRATTVRLGYDRVIALGDLTWTDYEVTVPVIVRSIGPEAGTGTSGHALVGLALRWQGHTAFRDAQPAWQYYPVGAYAWARFYDWPKLEIYRNMNFTAPDQAVFTDPRSFQFGAEYVMKARVETLGDGSTSYAFKMWLRSAPEPADWAVSITDNGPASGAIGLIAHHVDASFGTVQVTSVN